MEQHNEDVPFLRPVLFFVLTLGASFLKNNENEIIYFSYNLENEWLLNIYM